MYRNLVLVTLAVIIGQNDVATAQQHIPVTTTAAELWNPWTWFWPYAIASAEGYRDYFEKAQKATNELYKQILTTNAFPWLTGNWGFSQPQPQPNQNGQQENTGSGGGKQPSQEGQPNSEKPVQKEEPAQEGAKNESEGTEVQGNGTPKQK